MLKKVILSSALLLIVAGLGFTGDGYSIGDQVLAYWEAEDGTDGYFVGTLAESDNTVKGGGYLVVFEDTTTSIVPIARIRPFDLRAGSKVYALWSDGSMYPGKIARIVGRALYIQFDDGDKGWTSWAGIAVE